MFDKSKRAALGMALALPVAATAMAAAPPAAASTTDEGSPNQCVAQAQTVQQIKDGEIAQVSCFRTFPEAMASIGITVAPTETAGSYVARTRSGLWSRSEGSSMTNAEGDPVLAVSYGWTDGDSRYGSLTVKGPNCDNYGLNLGGAYADNWIKSTVPVSCGHMKHFDAPNFGAGATQTTDSTNINLNGAMYGTTSSIRYNP